MGAVLGGRIIPVLYGDAMAPAGVPTQIFFLIFPISFFGTPLSMALYVIEKSYANLIVYLALAVVNVSLDLLLIPRFGIIGAVIPVGLVIAASPVIYKRLLGRYVSGTRIPYAFIGKCFLASSPVLLLLPFAGFINDAFGLAAAVAAACALVLAGAKTVKLIGKEERDMLGSVPIPAVKWLVKMLS
jgi:O-antigen/teichoic acid export membrane protein